MKCTTKTLLFIFLFVLLIIPSGFAQNLVKEMPLKDQISFATQIVEGKVLDRKSFWNSNKTTIYTVSTIEVYKVFKGENHRTIHVISPGGFVENYGMQVSPSLQLHYNDTGMFILDEKNVSLINANANKFYKTVGTNQGFYRYDIMTDIYANPFKVSSGIVKNLYKDIELLTQQGFVDLKPLDVEKRRNEIQRRAAPNLITSISPTTISAGTQTILTIKGSGFGNTPGIVAFPAPNDGGSSYLDAYNSHIERWTDSEILVQVPSYAGTGRVRVTTSSDVVFLSANLVINYSHLNVELEDEVMPREYPTQFYDKNGNGGYDFFYDTFVSSNSTITDSFERAFYNWVCTTGVNWSLGGSTTAKPNLLGEPADGINVVGFRNDVDDDPSNGTTLAYAITRFIGCDNASGGIDVAVEDTDLVYNSDISFYYGTGNPGRSQIDFETVSLHELGHAHQLGHIIDPGALMHYSVNGSTAVRNLAPNDITGALAVFNRSANDQICGLDLMTSSSCALSTADIISKSITIYPNPASTSLEIKNKGEIRLMSVKVYDVRGRIILSRNLNSSKQLYSINVNHLNSGIYLVELNSDKGAISKKIIVE